jgi:hypothetical protein
VVVSSDLSEWKEAVAWTPGDGLKRVHVLNPPAGVPFFVRVVVAPLSSDLAATPAEMTSALVGTTRWGYKFTSATKFKWSWETGNWSYAKTALDQGVIVLTYDADGNRPEVYREEVVLTFTGKLKGTFRYSEYTHGVEDSGSVSEGTFDLSPIPP